MVRSRLRRRLGYPLRLAALVAWMGLIFLFSADSDSGQTSGGLLEALLQAVDWILSPILGPILGPIDPEARAVWHLLLRKAAHFTEYAILALLWTGVLPPGPRRLLLAFCLTTGYAVTDEIHQAFVPQRGPSPIDVLIDAAGAATALVGLRLAGFQPSGLRPTDPRGSLPRSGRS
jgi:VanZ family protein